MDSALQPAGTVNAWTMPIKARIDMLSTGIRTPVGIKIFGNDLNQISKLGEKLEAVLQNVRGTRSAYSERTIGGLYLDIVPRRVEIARYGLNVEDVLMVVETAIGGMAVDRTVEGRERYSINVRYARELRDDMNSLARVLVATPSGAQVPIAAIADIRLVQGPSMLRNENGLLTGYVYVDLGGRDVGGYVADAKKAVAENLSLPAGYALQWSGQYENMQSVRERLKVVLPLALFLIIVLLYFNTKSGIKTAIVLPAVPFSAIGAIWLLYLLGYNVSIAVWVGLIALMGLDAETGIFMLLFLDIAYYDAKKRGALRGASDLMEAYPRRGQARPAQDDDRRSGLHRTDTDNVVDRHRCGHDEAHRRADDRRTHHLVPFGVARVSCGLYDLEVASHMKLPAASRRVSDISSPSMGEETRPPCQIKFSSGREERVINVTLSLPSPIKGEGGGFSAAGRGK